MTSPSRNNPGDLLTLTNIRLDYGPFMAIRNVHLCLGYSEVHAVVGEHGAGKSSLGMLISGVLQPHFGFITFDGKTYPALTVNLARKLGIEMVHQHALSINDCFTVAENLFLATAPYNTLARKKKILHAATTFLSQYNIDLDPLIPVKKLTLPDRIFVDILKHLYANPRLLILDEALEKLSSGALHKVLDIMMHRKETGMSTLFITHRIDDIYHVADRVSIIKNGEILVTDEVKNIDKINLIKMAYTQISTDPQVDDLNKEFYQLLKYNEAILRNLPVNLIVTDKHNQIKMINNHCKQSFGLEDASSLQVPVEQLVSSTHEELLTILRRDTSSPEENIFYQVPITVNTVNIISNIKIFPIYDETFLIGNIIILEDVTEYDQLQKQVILSEKLASVGLLAAGVAHEINNPLEILYTHLGFMKHKFPAPEFHEALDMLHEQITSIANIVSNLHSFSENSLATTVDIDLNEVIRNMLKLIRHNASSKHITIHFEPYWQALFIRANTNEIKQVILNLFKNSVEAMPSGGEIFINTACIHQNGAEVAQVTFRDTGPGICDANPNNIFLPFYSTKKSQEQNLGLGLSVSYGIIKKYNGTITVKNTDQSGCEFVIALPQEKVS